MLCKVVIVVVFVVGASAFSQTGPTTPTPIPGAPGGTAATLAQGVSDLLVGVLLLTMAVASPWVTWRFLHWAGIEAGVALTTAVAASPIPATARAVGQQARFTAQWAVTQGAFSALGIGGRGQPGIGRRAAPPPSPRPWPGRSGAIGTTPRGAGSDASAEPAAPTRTARSA